MRCLIICNAFDDLKRIGLFSVPRILFDGWSGNDYHAMFSTEDVMLDCISTIVKYVTVCFVIFFYFVTYSRNFFLNLFTNRQLQLANYSYNAFF